MITTLPLLLKDIGSYESVCDIIYSSLLNAEHTSGIHDVDGFIFLILARESRKQNILGLI